MLPMQRECSRSRCVGRCRMHRMLIAMVCLWAGCPHPAHGAPSPSRPISDDFARDREVVSPLSRAEPPPSAPPAWVGEMASSHRLRFALERPGGGAPLWLHLGDSCDGYVLIRYEAHPETLTLRRGADTFTLVLRNGAVASASVTATPAGPVHAAEIAAAEVRRRDAWGADAITEPAQRHDGQWWVLVKHATAGRTEARMVILSDAGRVIDYWRV